MRISSLARRSVAAVSVAALLTAGGFASGLTVGVANAQTITSVSRGDGAAPVGVNNGVMRFRLDGSDFRPTQYTQQSVALRPLFTAPGQGNITGAVEDNSAQCGPLVDGVVVPDSQCDGPLFFTADLTNAAPGEYQVVVTQEPVDPTEAGHSDVAPNSVLVLSVGPASAATVGANGSTPGALVITGSNIARGARVVFYKTEDGAATSPDAGLVFTPTSYVSSTRLEGTYAANGSQADGLHYVRVFNTDQQNSPGPGPAFVQPRINSISPTAIGQGATAVPVTVTGGGFDSSTTASYSDPNVTASGPPSATSSTTLVVPTSVAPSTTTGTKSLTLRGTGGSYATAANVLTVTEKPVVTQNLPTRGQGSSALLTITGTGFTPGTDFDLGPGVVAETQSATATSASVQVTVSPDAEASTRAVKATNDDQGTSTRSSAFTVAPKPVITKISPPSGNRGDTVFVTITGNNLPSSGNAQITVSGTDITVGTVSGSGGNPGMLQTTFTIGSAAAFGPRDVTITNTGNGGTSTCDDCFGVNSLGVSPQGTTNAEDGNLRAITVTGQGLTAGTTVTLSLPGNPSYQPSITGTGTSEPDNGTLTRQFDLGSAATGDYTVTAVTGDTVLTCTGCFKVYSANAPEVTGVFEPAGDGDAPVAATAGQGATNRVAVITGKYFSRGENVTFTDDSPTAGAPSGIAVRSVTWNSPTQLTITYDVADGATVGDRGVRVTNIGDAATGKSADNVFTVNAGPKVTGISPEEIGQGAKNVDITISGSGFAPGAEAGFGSGTTTVVKSITASQIVATVTVADDAVTTSAREARVINTDGGAGGLVDALTVNPAPRVTAVSPNLVKPGTSNLQVTITGSGFVQQEGEGEPPAPVYTAVVIPGVTVSVTEVSEDGTTLKADVTVPANAPVGDRSVIVRNPDKGESIKPAAFRVGYPAPTPPTSVTATPGDGRVTLVFSGADGQGTSITGYVITTRLQDGTLVKETNATSSPVTITGLTNGTTYGFTIVAQSSGGSSEPSAAQTATPRFTTALSSTRSVSTATAGIPVTFSGVLSRTSSGARIAGVPVVLRLTPEYGAVRTFTATTSSTGAWAVRTHMVYNTTVRATFAGDGLNAPAAAPAYKLGVAPRIDRTSPANGSSTPAGTTLYVRGKVTPNKAGRVIVLRNGTTEVGRTTVAKDGTFAIPSRLARGTYVLRVYIGASTGNVAGYSAPFRIYRT